MLTVAYCRVSTEDQAKEGHSIPAQIRILTDYAKTHDLAPLRVICDEGISGGRMDRPGIVELLDLVERERFGAAAIDVARAHLAMQLASTRRRRPPRRGKKDLRYVSRMRRNASSVRLASRVGLCQRYGSE